MRSKVAVALVATLVAFSFAGPAFARHPTIWGEVVAANPSAKTLTIKTEFGPMTFRVDERAGGAWANLKPGDKVTVGTYSFTSMGPREGECWVPKAEAAAKN